MAKMYLSFAILISGIATAHGAEPGQTSKEQANKPRVMATEGVLITGATRAGKEKAVTARLRATRPHGYTLIGEQMPHITQVRCQGVDWHLPVIEAAVGRV